MLLMCYGFTRRTHYKFYKLFLFTTKELWYGINPHIKCLIEDTQTANKSVFEVAKSWNQIHNCITYHVIYEYLNGSVIAHIVIVSGYIDDKCSWRLVLSNGCYQWQVSYDRSVIVHVLYTYSYLLINSLKKKTLQKSNTATLCQLKIERAATYD